MICIHIQQSYFHRLLFSITVKMFTKKKISTSKIPCNEEKDYSFFRCIEDFYAERRGCQFPWNIDNSSNINICKKYSEISSVLLNFFNRDTGAKRETFRLSDILMNAGKHCARPCLLKKFEVKFDRWSLMDQDKSINKPTTSLKIVLDGFVIKHEEEFLKCDSTCIIGEVGGNLGFFVGGSILLGIDILFMGINEIATRLRKKNSRNENKSTSQIPLKINIGKTSTIII